MYLSSNMQASQTEYVSCFEGYIIITRVSYRFIGDVYGMMMICLILI